MKHQRLVHGVVRIVRNSLVSAVIVLCAGAAAYASWHTVGTGGKEQPNPIFQVDPGMVPVVSPRWSARTGSVIVPAQSVGRFSDTSGADPSGGDHLVQVLHFLPPVRLTPGAQATPTYAAASSNTQMRFSLEVRPVQVTQLPNSYDAVQGIGASDLIAAHYIYSLGTGDVVRGTVPPTRLLDYPITPPDIPIIVQYRSARHVFALSVSDIQPGWTAVMYPLGTTHPVALRRSTDGTALRLRFPLPTMYAASLLRYSDRPTINIGWLVVRDTDGTLVASTAVRY